MQYEGTAAQATLFPLDKDKEAFWFEQLLDHVVDSRLHRYTNDSWAIAQPINTSPPESKTTKKSFLYQINILDQINIPGSGRVVLRLY